MNSFHILQFCVNIMLSSLPLALFWSFSCLDICGSGLLIQMPRCRALYKSVWIYLHIFLFMKFNGSQDFTSQHAFWHLSPCAYVGEVLSRGSV